MVSTASEAPLGFLAVISRSWRIFQKHPGSLLLAAVPTVLASLLLTLALAHPLSVFVFLKEAFPHASIVSVLQIALVINDPVARKVMPAVAGVLWTFGANSSPHKVVKYLRTEGQEAREVGPTRGRSRLVKFMKVLSTTAVCWGLCGGLAYGWQLLPWGFVFPTGEEGGWTCPK